jgi:hypothetical protein
MQILDATPTKPVAVDPELMAVLEDIARNVEIRDDFSIHHPSYKPLEIPAEAVERFQKMPEQMRQKFLGLQLRSFLYGIYYNGGMRSALALDSDDQAVQLDLENNTVLGIDMAFFQQLHDANCGTGYFEKGWKVLQDDNFGGLLVKSSWLRLFVQRAKHLCEDEKLAQVGDMVSIKMPKNRVQNGFYMAVSNSGFSYPQPESILVRMYFNLTIDGSIAIMKDLTNELNHMNIRFNFKVLYNPMDYDRFDSGVLYFDKSHYKNVLRIVESIYFNHRTLFKSETPLFTKRINIGIGVAEEINQKLFEGESFGLNRCQLMSNAILASFNQGEKIQSKMLVENFSKYNIDMNATYLNQGSIDIY